MRKAEQDRQKPGRKRSPNALRKVIFQKAKGHLLSLTQTNVDTLGVHRLVIIDLQARAIDEEGR